MINMVRIGNLNKRIQLLKPVLEEDTGLGQQASYVEAGTIWAELLKQRITPGVISGDGSAVLITQGIRIRPNDEIQKGWHIKLKGREYNVIDIDCSDPTVYVLTTETVET